MWTDLYLHMSMLAVRFTWPKRLKQEKLLLWRKYEWTTRERGYIFEYFIIRLWVHKYFIRVFLHLWCPRSVSSAFTNFYLKFYMLFSGPKSEVAVIICYYYSCIFPLNLIVNFVIAVSHNCYTRNKNSKETTPWKCDQAERNCDFSRYCLKDLNVLCYQNDLAFKNFFYLYLTFCVSSFRPWKGWTREARQVIHSQ